MVAKVQISYIEAVITCPNCGKPRDSQLPGAENAIYAGYEFRCVACNTVYEINIVMPARDAELRNEADDAGHTCPCCEGEGNLNDDYVPQMCWNCNGTGQV